jgi:DNA-binding CsgD family transcriptional regulator
MRLVIGTILSMFTLLTYSQDKDINDYLKYIDSAYETYDEQPQLATTYLDSILEPIEVNIKGNLSDYYRLRGLINDRLNNHAELFHDFLMALKYAKIEENYDIAGVASIELFFNSYFIKKDSSALNYLDDAKMYFKKSANPNGLVEVQQMYAYVEFYKENYAQSNAMILQNLQDYKNIKDDGYYYMYALFMLSSGYVHLGDLNNTHKYFNKLKALEHDTTIPKNLYKNHKVSIYGCLAEYHLESKSLDSTLYYLNKSKSLRHSMNTSDTKLYFNLYAKYFEQIEDIKQKENYLDSLIKFEARVLDKTMTASLRANESLKKTHNQLEIESSEKQFNKKLAIILLGIVCVLFILFILLYKKYKVRIKKYIIKAKTSSDLQSSHEKLKVKVVGLEQYIIKLKDEIKMISSITNPLELRKNIKDLYKNIHLKSSTELMNGESHLDLIYDLNIEFFTKIKATYPQLNESEIIICYYIFTGFKNREIASFLNTSIRSVESKRYRINKKLEINSKETNLQELLQNTLS